MSPAGPSRAPSRSAGSPRTTPSASRATGLYRNGSLGGTLTQAGVDIIGTVMFDRLTGRTRTPVTYELSAFDAAGNVSAPATLVVIP